MRTAIAFGAVVADWGGGHMGGGWPWFSMALLIILFVAVLAVVAVLLARLTNASEPSVDGARRARELLMERYARGEIDGDEFDERSRRLR